MSSYGLLSSGFVQKPLEVTKQEIEDELKSTISPSLNTSAASVVGQLIAPFVTQLTEVWELLQLLSTSNDPDEATDTLLEHIAAITGVTRLPATESTAVLYMTGTPTTLVEAGRIISVLGDATARFVTLADATIAASTAWAGSTVYAADDVVTNGGNIYICTTGGTSAGSGGPTGTGTAIADNTVIWRYLGAGTGYITVNVEAESTGPTVANGYTLTEIETPVSGWDNATNPDDATLGTDEETDEELRARRDALLRAQGNATVEAIRADLLSEVTGVTDARVFENTTDVTDGDGLPPHSFEAVVLGGVNQDIADSLWASKAAGIATYGTITETVVDSQEVSHSIKFSRPTTVTVHIEVTLTTDSNYPADGDTQVKEAIANIYGAALEIGDDVVISQLYEHIFSVSGVVDVTAIKVDTVDPPTGTTNLVIDDRELADIQTANIDVISS